MPKSKASQAGQRAETGVKTDNSGNDAASYADLKRQLDEVLDEMQSPDCEVDRAAVLYEQALGLIDRLEKQLGQVENRIEKLHADFMVRSGQ